MRLSVNFKVAIIWLSIFSLLGCTSMQPVNIVKVPIPQSNQSSSDEQTNNNMAEPSEHEDKKTRLSTEPKLKIKDNIIVYEKSGRVINMTVTSFDNQTITGSLVSAPLTTVSVNLNDVHQIEVESIDGLKTTGAVVGTIVLLPLVILLSFVILIDETNEFLR
ncbi:MAG: hypothetical protein OEY96_06600 [Gammaproteobacteria bacterium]|nr:hypothetical protein [Gammaproteobacteria bacterium]